MCKSSCKLHPPPPACAYRLLELAISSNFLGSHFFAASTDVAKCNLTSSLPAVIPVIILFFLIFSQPARLNKDMLRRHFGRTRHTVGRVSVGGLFSVRGTGQHKQEKVFAMPVRPVATQRYTVPAQCQQFSVRILATLYHRYAYATRDMLMRALSVRLLSLSVSHCLSLVRARAHTHRVRIGSGQGRRPGHASNAA